jgi:DNA-binding NarL/FixJ family response regulator
MTKPENRGSNTQPAEIVDARTTPVCILLSGGAVTPRAEDLQRALERACGNAPVRVVVAEVDGAAYNLPLPGGQELAHLSSADAARLGEQLAAAVGNARCTVAAAPRHPDSGKAVVLTPRQVEVLKLVAEGYSVRQIAALLDISPKTAEFHKGQIMQRLGRHNTAELVKYAIEHGISDI